MSIKGFDFNGVIHKYDYNALDNKPNMDAMIGSPLVAEDVASMTDTSRIYVYTGSETGYTNGNWYYYNGTSWVSGGVYNSVAISDAQIGGAVADWLEDHPEATAVADGSITAQKLASGLLDSSEAWAVGQINGTDVASTDARYHNNSKYYAQQASASATQASADAAEIRQINTNSISFTEASTRANIESGESLSVMLGKTKKWFSDLGESAFNDIANNLTTEVEGSVLDARQGKALSDRLATDESTISSHTTSLSSQASTLNSLSSTVSSHTTSLSSHTSTLNSYGTRISNVESAVSSKIASYVGMIIFSSKLDTAAKVKAIYGGTTWVQIQGRMLIGASSSYKNGTTGGAASVSYKPAGTVGGHTLTLSEIPSHSHTFPISYAGNTGSNNGFLRNTTAGTGTQTTSSAGGGGSHSHGFTGTSATIATMPPYRAVYIWERTA